MNGFTVEMIMRVYDDQNGSYIECAPDPDIPGLFMLRAIESEGSEYVRIPALEADQLAKLHAAIGTLLAYVATQK